MWDELLKELGELFDRTMYPGLIRLILILNVDVDISQKLQLNYSHGESERLMELKEL